MSFVRRSLSSLLVALVFAGCAPEKKPVTFTSVAVTAAAGGTSFVSIGETRQLTAVVESSEGPKNDAALFTWTSSAPNIATVDATGLVTSVSNGKATIAATIGKLAGTIELTVNQATTSLTISPTQAAIESGATQQFTVTAKDAAGHTASLNNVLWSVGMVAVASVDNRGLATGNGAGSTTITATLGTLTASAELDVSAAVATSVTVSGPDTIGAIEGTSQLAAQAFDVHSAVIPDAVITWSSANEAVATVDASGNVTAISNGTSEITAHAGSASGHLTITVLQVVNAVLVTPNTVTLLPGRTQTFVAAPVDAHNHAVAGAPAATWSSSVPGAATIDTSGVATTLAVATLTASTITATVAGVSGTATLTVDPNAVDIQSVSISGGGVTFTSLGETAQLTGEARDSLNAVVPNVTIGWTSSDSAVATVDAAGLVTAVGNGEARITGSAGGHNASTPITVAQVVDSVVVVTANAGDPLVLTSFGDTLQLVAHAFDANEHAIQEASFVWSAGTAASVDTTGLVTAVSDGASTIQATFDGVTGELAVTVAQAVAVVVVSAGASTTLESIGATVQLSAVAQDAGGTAVSGAAISWSSSDEVVATVDTTGLVTAQAIGVATIRAASGGHQGELIVHVSLPTVAVTPTTFVLPARIGTDAAATKLFAAVMRDGTGTTIPGVSFTWGIGDMALAAINMTSGLVTVVQAQSGAFLGSSTTVTATGNGTSGTAELFVAVHPTFAFATTGGAGLAVNVDQGQYVVFKNTDGAPHSIVWDTPGAPSAVPTFNGATDSTAVRATQAAGSYSFHCGIHGTSMKGTLTIH